MDLGLRDRVVFITGASGGIGGALATSFAEEGAKLVLHGHHHFAELRERAMSRWPAERTLLLGFDVSDPEQTSQAMSAAAARFGRVDVCIANAGIWPSTTERLDELAAERFRRTIEVDLLGAAWTARAFMRTLAATAPRDDCGASLLFIGSTAGRFGERGHSDYSAAKAGLYGLVRSLKNEIVTIDPRGRVNMIEPGWTMTEMARDALKAPDALTRVARTMALRQVARANDIAQAALFLSSPAAAAHVSGEVLTIAGGMEGRLLWERREIDPDAILRRCTD